MAIEINDEMLDSLIGNAKTQDGFIWSGWDCKNAE